MEKKITVTRTSGTTKYHKCTNVVHHDNGNISFTGRKGSCTAVEGDYIIGAGTYEEIEIVPEDECE